MATPRPRRPAGAPTGPSATALALALTAVLALAPVTPAHADGATGAPVTAPDRLTVRGGGTGVVDVVRNDSDPDADPLELCRVDVPDGVPLRLERDARAADGSGNELPQPLTLVSTSFAPGTYTVTYYACDLVSLTPGTVTVTVTRTRPVRLRKVAPHVVRFTNPDTRAVVVSYFAFGPRMAAPDEGAVRLRPGQARRVRVVGRQLSWTAYAARTGDRAGDGYVRGVARG